MKSATARLFAAGALDLVNRSQLPTDLLAFFADRLKVQLREQGARHDLVDAVFVLEGRDDLLLIVRRVEALAQFLDSEDGKNCSPANKRATNIIRIEEKKDGRAIYRGAATESVPASGGKSAGANNQCRQDRGRPRSAERGFRCCHARHGKAAAER